jgi:hypothetical protein
MCKSRPKLLNIVGVALGGIVARAVFQIDPPDEMASARARLISIVIKVSARQRHTSLL